MGTAAGYGRSGTRSGEDLADGLPALRRNVVAFDGGDFPSLRDSAVWGINLDKGRGPIHRIDSLLDMIRKCLLACFVVFAVAAKGDEPAITKYAGEVGSVERVGRISFIVNRGNTHVGRLRCSFTARDNRHDLSSIFPEHYRVSINSGSRRFRIHGKKRGAFYAEGYDRNSLTTYLITGRMKRRGLYQGTIQHQQKVTLNLYDPTSGEYANQTYYRGFQGPVRYSARALKSRAVPQKGLR